MLKMTQTLMIDFGRVNAGRAANGLPNLTWEQYRDQVEAQQPPEILPTTKRDIAARAAEIAAGQAPFNPRPADFLAYALPAQTVAAFVPPDIDPVLYQRNLDLTRGLMPYIVGDMRKELYFTLGITDAIPDAEKEEAAAELMAQIVTYAGYDLGELARAAQSQMPAGAGTAFFRAVQNEFGRTLQHVGGFTKSFSKVPVLNKIIGPMGMKVFGEIIAQTGNMLRGGSVRDWDDRAFVSSLSESMRDMGKLCMYAAPFLPAPWNAIIGAIGAVSLTASKVMGAHIAQAEAKERAERDALTGQAAALNSPTDEEIMWAVNVLLSSRGEPPRWAVTPEMFDQAVAIIQSPRVQQMIAQGAQGYELAGAGCACFV